MFMYMYYLSVHSFTVSGLACGSSFHPVEGSSCFLSIISFSIEVSPCLCSKVNFISWSASALGCFSLIYYEINKPKDKFKLKNV